MVVAFVAAVTLAAPIEEVVVEGDAPGATDPAATHAALTVVSTATAGGTDDIASLLATTPGAHVRRLGGLGELATVTLRGSAARQVVVLVDGIPLNPEGTASVDLSELPVHAFDRVEVWRSGAPPSLGGGGIGGSVNLITGDAPARRVSIGAGAWGTGRLAGVAAGPAPWGDGFIAVDGLSTRGDFRMLDDGGTPWTVLDDRRVDRLGNDTLQGSVHGRLRWETGAVEWTALNAALVRDEGVPGLSWTPTPGVRYAAWRNLTAVQATSAAGASRVTGRVWGWTRRESLDDRDGAITLATTWTDDRSHAVGAHAGLLMAPSAVWSLDLAGDVRSEAWRGGDRITDTVRSPRSRVVGTGGAATTVRWRSLAATPQIAALALRPNTGDSLAYVLPRLGVLAALPSERTAVTLKANVGRGARPPDLFELYGDRGVTVGNPDLRPERATSSDLGAVVASESVALEAGVFGSITRDRIAWTRNGQGVARAENIDRSLSRGVELGGTLQWPPYLVTRATLTHLLATVPDTGTYVPWIPAWSGWAEIAVESGPVRLAPNLSVAAGTWRDSANFVRDPPRTLAGVSAAWQHEAWSIATDVRNLFDTIAVVAPADPLDGRSPDAVRPMSDFQGFPLPGRTWMLTVEWTP